MQTLHHKNIPTILGVQVQKEPISLVIEFIGEQDTSVTISKLLTRQNEETLIQNLQKSLTVNDWLIISHNLA